MDTPIMTQYDPIGRSAINALRRWLVLPIVLAALGAAAGLYAGSRAKPSAEAILRAESSAVDGAAMKIVQQSAVLELDTASVYQAAAKASGSTAADLRTRTQIAAVPDSQLISVTVTASTESQAIAQADAIVHTALTANDRRTEAELDSVTASTRKLVKHGKLPDADAEQARVARLGDTLGQNQSELVIGGRSLTLLQGAEASSLLPSAKLLGALGLLAGALLGSAVALFLGLRRGRIQSARELHQLYPQAAVVDGLDLESVITLESENASAVYIAGIHHDRAELEQIADVVRTQFIAGGRPVQSPEPRHNVTVSEQAADLQIIITSLSDTVLRRVARDTSALLIIPVRPKVTRMQQLEPFASRLNDRTYLLVQQTTPDWD
ncbi:hypothetical protein [Microlunatus soli]|uniref:Capsular polysaccharide biosynthesis protein n=1 Tax=Microlunatus soli TaxID=630515 RepID=A0A1H1WCX4_9ACTN|nr:hypothetical protein [Microlunatus soli]SDS94885.1 hypothetical protein SAMN04489812_3594 [Microlunatus soli]